MKIIEKEEGISREGYKKLYLTVQNNRGINYLVSITLEGNRVIKSTCTCKHGTFAIMKKVKDYKICRHIKFAFKQLDVLNITWKV